MTPTRSPGRRAEDQPDPERPPALRALQRLWALPLVKELLVVIITVWTMMGGSFETPSTVILRHIEAESRLNARQDSDLSQLRLAIADELIARQHADSVAEERQLQNRFYLRILALGKCLDHTSRLPQELAPYCEQLRHGRDFPDPLRP